MNTFLILTALIAAAWLLFSFRSVRKQIRRRLYSGAIQDPTQFTQAQFANIGDGTFDSGIKSYLPDAATSYRYLCYKVGSTADNVALAGAGDTPLGASDDQAEVGMPIAINLFGAVRGTVRVVTDGTATNGSPLKCAANGQVALATTSGTDIVIGRAIIPTETTKAAGDVISMIPIMPGKHPF